MTTNDVISKKDQQSWKEAFKMLNMFDGNKTINMDEAEMLLHTLLHTSPYGMLLINLQGIAVMVNPIIETLFGYTSEEVVGKVIWELPQSDDGKKLLKKLFQQIITGRPEPVPYFGCVQTKIDALAHIRIDWNYILNKANEVQGLVCIVRDISKEIQHHTDSGPAMLEQVQYSRLATVEEVVARISHELNQPLSAIINFSGGTLKRLENEYPNSDIMQSMQMIVRQAQRAGDVIDRLKNFLRKGELRKESLNINQVVKEVIDCMRPELYASKVCVEFELENLMPAVLADKIQIEQVLLNIIQNALESMRLIDEQKRQMTIKTFKNDIDSVGIKISDKGHGIDAENLAKIFEAFFTTKSTGMGIGLAISQSIINAHGGEIKVESTIAKTSSDVSGTSFTVTLPIRTTTRLEGNVVDKSVPF